MPTYGESAVMCICAVAMTLEDYSLEYHMVGPSAVIDTAMLVTADLLGYLNDKFTKP